MHSDIKSNIGAALAVNGVDRRDFLALCASFLAAPTGVFAVTDGVKTPKELANKLSAAKRPSVIWLNLQACSGCGETLLRSSQPGAAELAFSILSLDYHELLMAGGGRQAEQALSSAIHDSAGKYLLILEGAMPGPEQFGALMIAGRPAAETLRRAVASAAAVIAMGSCASWGGVVAAAPNPSSATSVIPYLGDKPYASLPGCPPNPSVLLATALEFAAKHQLPQLDDKHRPRFAYDALLHDRCERRPHFDAGRMARKFGDEKHRKGYCLFALGCKGPVTHAPCSSRGFNEIKGCWPVGVGAPCFGCAEQGVGFQLPAYQIAPVAEDE